MCRFESYSRNQKNKKTKPQGVKVSIGKYLNNIAVSAVTDKYSAEALKDLNINAGTLRAIGASSGSAGISSYVSTLLAERQQNIGGKLQSAINRKAGLGVSLYKNWVKGNVATTDATNEQKAGTDIILG